MNVLYNMKFGLVGVVILSLQSCFVAKDYEQPEVIEEANYRTDEIDQDSLNMATVSWKDMFTDPILQDYISKGLENNIDIRVAMQQINAAEAYVKKVKLVTFQLWELMLPLLTRNFLKIASLVVYLVHWTSIS